MKTLLVIGTGNLMSALLKGQARTNAQQSWEYLLLNRTFEKAKALEGNLAPLKVKAVKNSDSSTPHAIFLGVKPKQLPEILLSYPWLKDTEAEIISTMAAISIDQLKRAFPKARIISRLMPNIAVAEVNSPAIGYTTDLKSSILALWYKSIGELYITHHQHLIDEFLLIFGSSPAYMATFLAPWLAELSHEIPPVVSKNLLIDLMISALVFLRNKDLEDVIEKVKTPGGITAEALKVFDDEKLAGIFTEALLASANRAKEIGKSFNS